MASSRWRADVAEANLGKIRSASLRNPAPTPSRRAFPGRREPHGADRGSGQGHGAGQGRVRCPRPAHPARNECQGRFPHAEMAADRRQAWIVRHKDAIAQRHGRPVVFVVAGASRRAGRRGGEAIGDLVAVAGLKVGDRLVARVPDGLKDGDKVRPAAQGEAAMNDPCRRPRRHRKSYCRGGQAVPVLTCLSFTIAAGEFLALMGPSGSEKARSSTSSPASTGPDSRRLVVAGQDIGRLAEAELADWRARHVGFIFQFYNLMPVLSARENVELPPLLKNLPVAERRRRAGDALAMVGLADRLEHRPAELSGGQQQRVAIARR